MLEKIKRFWEKLPAEIKVAVYLAVSYGMAAVITELSNMEISNKWLAIAINILLVFLRELKPRIAKIKGE
ncbi:MAG: hypothetical protein WC648_04640 [Candidatus Paceibacterota bacterium]